MPGLLLCFCVGFEVQLRSLGLHGKCFYPWGHLTTPYSIFSMCYFHARTQCTVSKPGWLSVLHQAPILTASGQNPPFWSSVEFIVISPMSYYRGSYVTYALWSYFTISTSNIFLQLSFITTALLLFILCCGEKERDNVDVHEVQTFPAVPLPSTSSLSCQQTLMPLPSA